MINSQGIHCSGPIEYKIGASLSFAPIFHSKRLGPYKEVHSLQFTFTFNYLNHFTFTFEGIREFTFTFEPQPNGATFEQLMNNTVVRSVIAHRCDRLAMRSCMCVREVHRSAGVGACARSAPLA
jgi:hypothetical protein